MYTEMRTMRDKFRASEKERIDQEKVIRELKSQLAASTKESLTLRKKLFTQTKIKTDEENKQKIQQILKSEPISL